MIGCPPIEIFRSFDLLLGPPPPSTRVHLKRLRRESGRKVVVELISVIYSQTKMSYGGRYADYDDEPSRRQSPRGEVSYHKSRFGKLISSNNTSHDTTMSRRPLRSPRGMYLKTLRGLSLTPRNDYLLNDILVMYLCHSEDSLIPLQGKVRQYRVLPLEGSPILPLYRDSPTCLLPHPPSPNEMRGVGPRNPR
jgi:hypothetical protein